jgi:hypothetical protein
VSGRPDRPGHEDVLARDLPCLAGELRRGRVDRLDFVPQPDGFQFVPVRAERVGLDDARARFDVGEVRLEHGVRLREAELLDRPAGWNDLPEQVRPHRPVHDEQGLFQHPAEPGGAHGR